MDCSNSLRQILRACFVPGSACECRSSNISRDGHGEVLRVRSCKSEHSVADTPTVISSLRTIYHGTDCGWLISRFWVWIRIFTDDLAGETTSTATASILIFSCRGARNELIPTTGPTTARFLIIIRTCCCAVLSCGIAHRRLNLFAETLPARGQPRELIGTYKCEDK